MVGGGLGGGWKREVGGEADTRYPPVEPTDTRAGIYICNWPCIPVPVENGGGRPRPPRGGSRASRGGLRVF